MYDHYNLSLDRNSRSGLKTFQVENVESAVRNNLEFSQLVVNFEMQRSHPFHTMTLFLPILALTILAPVGLILPGQYYQPSSSNSWIWEISFNIVNSVNSGEKMSFQVTILLADIIYVEIVRSTVPIFDSLVQTPLLMSFVAISITLLCFCLLLTTHTLYLYHCPEYEARNFSKSEARVSRDLANVSLLFN